MVKVFTHLTDSISSNDNNDHLHLHICHKQTEINRLVKSKSKETVSISRIFISNHSNIYIKIPSV